MSLFLRLYLFRTCPFRHFFGIFYLLVLRQSSKHQHRCRLHFPAMTLTKTSAKPANNIPPRQPPRIALALAGGGPLDAIYEIGALCALDESLQVLSLTQLHHY